MKVDKFVRGNSCRSLALHLCLQCQQRQVDQARSSCSCRAQLCVPCGLHVGYRPNLGCNSQGFWAFLVTLSSSSAGSPQGQKISDLNEDKLRSPATSSDQQP